MINQENLDQDSVSVMNALKGIYQELLGAANSKTVKLSDAQKKTLNEDIDAIRELLARIEAQVELLK